MADVMQYREVRQRFSVRDDDGPDSDLHPDRHTVTGTVEFTPRLPKGDVIAYPEEFVKPMPITGRIIAGELFANWVVSDQEEPRPLYLPVTVDDEADQTWSWIMRVSSLLIDGQEASIKMGDREFQVEAGEGPLWLSTVAAVPKGGGTITTRGPAGPGLQEITAADGEIVFQWDNGKSTSIDVPDAVPGPPGPRGPKGETGDTRLDAGEIPIVVGDYTVTIAGTPVVTDTKIVPQGTDLTDTSPGGRINPGLWSVPNNAHAGTITGLPPGVTSCAFQQWPYNPAAAAAARILFAGNNRGVWYQSLSGANVWQPWVRLDNEPPPESIDAQHSTRREALSRAKGNRIGTGGKGVVALRFDHNMAQFQSKILPLLAARSLPASQCHFINEMNPQPGYTNDDSTGSSWAQVQDNAIMHGIEAWSHGRTHTDASGYQAIKHELADARAELEGLLPRLEIPGLMVPGVTGTRFDGWSDNLSSPGAWSDWEAGRIVAAHYASCDAHGGLLTAAGTALGWQSYFVDSQTSPGVTTALIDEAASTGSVAVIALHPNRVDATGGIPLSVYEQILDHIVTLRDQGRIEVLTVSGATVADPSTSWRPDITRGWDSWFLGSGWTTVQDGIRGVGPTGNAALAVNSSRYNWGEGHVWEAWAEFDGDGDLELRVALNSDGTEISRSVSGGGMIRIPFTIPHDEPSVSMRMSVASGTVTVSGVGIRAT